MFTNILRRASSTRYACRAFSSAASSSGQESKKASQALLLIIPVTTFGLGTWQVYRLQWKKDLIKQMEERTTSTPVPLPDNEQDLLSMEYRRVALRGEFDHSKEIILGPRSITQGNSPTFGPQNTSGYHVITPFTLENGKRVLVNRGWVDRKKVDANTRREGQVTGPVNIIGFVRKGEEKRTFMPANDPVNNQWHFSEVPAMAQHADTSRVLIDADATCTIPGGPIGGQTRITLRNEHMQYILTWYSLTIATAYMYYRLRKTPASIARGKSI